MWGTTWNQLVLWHLQFGDLGMPLDTCREAGPGSGCLHLLPGVGQHVVALSLIDQVPACF